MNKYLEKIAAPIYNDAFKAVNTARRRFLNGKNVGLAGVKRMIGGSAIGGGVGVAANTGTYDEWDDNKSRYVTKKHTTGQRVAGGIAGALLGGFLGANSGRVVANSKFDKKMGASPHRIFGDTKHGRKLEDIIVKAKGKSFSAPPRTRTRNVSDILKDLGAPTGGFKTKEEAKKHFRRAAMKNHPDRGGNVDAMQKINKAFDEFQAHPEGFSKLAGYRYLSKVVETVKKNPGFTIGGSLGVADGVASTTKQPGESRARFHLRQVRNAATHGLGGAVAGEILERFIKSNR